MIKDQDLGSTKVRRNPCVIGIIEDKREYKMTEMDQVNQEEQYNDEVMEPVESGSDNKPSNYEAVLEGILFTMGEPVERSVIAMAMEIPELAVEAAVTNLQKTYEAENRGLQIIRLEDSYQLCTKPICYEPLIRIAARPRKPVLTDVVMETLAIIAYKQPITKMEIEKIRGVSSDHAVNKLVEYGLVCEAGRLNAPGRPMLFATTEEFLRRFQVESLDELPIPNPEKLAEIQESVAEETGYYPEPVEV